METHSVVKVAYVPIDVHEDREPQIMLSVLRTHSTHFQEKLEKLIREPLIEKYMGLYTKEPVLFPTRVGSSQRAYAFGYGKCGRMFYDQNYLHICFSITREQLKEVSVTCMVTFEALRLSFEGGNVRPSFSISSLCADQIGGYKVMGTFTQKPGHWFKNGEYTFPEHVAWEAEHAMYEVLTHLNPGPAHVDCRVDVSFDGRFCLSCRGKARTGEIFSDDPFDDTGTVSFSSAFIHGPDDFMTLLSGLCALCSFLNA